MPAESVYRHVAPLARAGVLQVVAERRVRGAVERTYTLLLFAAQIQPEEVAAMTPDEHAHAFMAFVAGPLADFDQYLAGGDFDPIRDEAGYRAGAIWLTDAEYADFVRELVADFQPWLANPPGKGCRRRMVYTVVLPASPRAATARPGVDARGGLEREGSH